MLLFILGFNLLQWLTAPYMVDVLYRVQEASNYDHPQLYEIIRRLCQRTGIDTPRIMIAHIPIPNAFAYGSPLAGTRVAVTTGLLKTLETEEVEAILGHELGHIKHRDVQVMMFASVLPAIVYYLGFSLFRSSNYRNRNRSSGAALGSISMLIYFVLTLLSLRLSRLREYYADRHSVNIVEDGARKLSEGLAKIVTYTGKMRLRGTRVNQYSNFKTLFISNPETATRDVMDLRDMGQIISDQQLVHEIRSRNIAMVDSMVEAFSTHPNIIKRLKALQELHV
jgi:heat shock protein HtpX